MSARKAVLMSPASGRNHARMRNVFAREGAAVKSARAAGAGGKKTPAGRVLSTWMEWGFADILEEKAEARGLSVSRYLRQVLIADVENVKDEVILASLKKLERRTRKIDDSLHEFMRNAEVVDTDD